MDLAKVEAVVKWEMLNIIIEVRSFLGIVEYYSRFVKGFSSIATPLTQLTKKNIKFQWDESCEASFSEFKQKLTTASVLTIPTDKQSYAVYSDASCVGLGCVLI